MYFLVRFKALLNAFISFINNLPRRHFFALIILFVCLLVISFLPSQSKKAKSIKRQLILPIETVISDDYASAEPIEPEKERYGETAIDFTGSTEIRLIIKEGDSLSNLFQKKGEKKENEKN